MIARFKKFLLLSLPIILTLNFVTHTKNFITKKIKPEITETVDDCKKLPIFYNPNYNLADSFWGMSTLASSLHSFNPNKYKEVFTFLQNELGLTLDKIYSDIDPVTDQQLLSVHTQAYLDSLSSTETILSISEISHPFLAWVPLFILNSALLIPMKYATGGTIAAAAKALEEGWAINLGGGYHHAKADNGEGFCFFADINIAINELRKTNPNLKVLIVDLDAHQGNGHEMNSNNDPLITIFDIYNERLYPHDAEAKKYITYNFPIKHRTQDQEYLAMIENELPKAIQQSQPKLLFYVAGTDIYERDPLGCLGITKKGILRRDELVFKCALESKIPIVMLLAGGYTKESSSIIADSIITKILPLVGAKA